MTDGLPLPQRSWAILAIGLGVTLAVIDSAIANIALPTIASDLHTDPALSIWIVNGYQLAITVSLLPLSSLGDNLGYRRIYLGGLVLFTAASLACAFSTSLPMLALARVIQGFGAAGIMSVNTALLRFIYPQAQLGRGIGINALVVAVASAIGPTVASGILAFANWPWLFAVNVPIGIAAVLVGLRSLPRTPPSPHRFDVASALLSAATFGLLIGSIDALGHGEGFPLFIVEIVATIGLGYVLVKRQLSMTAPLLPVDLLKIPVFTLSVSTSISTFAAQMLALVSLPFLFQNELHFSAVETGFLITPWPLAICIAAPLAGRLADRYSAGLLGGIGLFCFAMGLLSFAFLPAHPGHFDLAWRMVLCGFGFGIFQSPNNRAMLTAAPRERSGGASGMLGTARLLGQTTGAALAALLFARLGGQAPTVALLIASGFALVAACVSLARLYDMSPSAGQRASNPEADPTLHATLLRKDAEP
ncbi:MAG: transporter, family, multidrug resistance protein [Alphaproteobacteria bacterium]|jgi:DHA2 family multidrug resistance protein-like MFS transporter|nr:transporter, family, multidrug resistance protein [Alphaproteobacteria bacterium]